MSTTTKAQAGAAPVHPGFAPRRWDPLVRLTHWGVAAAIVVNGMITEEGSSPHIWIGYAAGALLALRLLWGVVGPAEARFSAFPPSPRRALAHLGDIAAGRRTEHRSHNPLGALMVYALWATLAVVVLTGVSMTGGRTPSPLQAAPETAGQVLAPAQGEEAEDEADEHEAGEAGEAAGDGEGREEMMEEIHEVAANLLFVLAALHLAGVAFETRRSGRRVVRAMLPFAPRPPRTK